MYLNPYQKRIAELVDEYGNLTKTQLLRCINLEFKTGFSTLDAYILQMCRYGDYEEIPLGADTLLTLKGAEPHMEMTHAIEVMQSFFPNVLEHHRGKAPILIRFFATGKPVKEVCIIPVKAGEEHILETYVEDKFSADQIGTVLYLCESREQLERLRLHGRFAVVGEQGPLFYKK